MKYILTNTQGEIFGAFTKIDKLSDGYLCDNSILYTVITGEVTESEVPDDYMTPSQIENYNNNQSQLRAKAYPVESDPIFFEWQRGTKTQQEWLDAVDQVKLQYPYKSI
jgi:hypothetical protein